MTRPVSAWPSITASPLSHLNSHSSLIRLTKKTSQSIDRPKRMEKSRTMNTSTGLSPSTLMIDVPQPHSNTAFMMPSWRCAVRKGPLVWSGRGGAGRVGRAYRAPPGGGAGTEWAGFAFTGGSQRRTGTIRDLAAAAAGPSGCPGGRVRPDHGGVFRCRAEPGAAVGAARRPPRWWQRWLARARLRRDRRWEYERAFCGSQYALMAPLFEHYGVQLWMPEAGGRVNAAAEERRTGWNQTRRPPRSCGGSSPGGWPAFPDPDRPGAERGGHPMHVRGRLGAHYSSQQPGVVADHGAGDPGQPALYRPSGANRQPRPWT